MLAALQSATFVLGLVELRNEPVRQHILVVGGTGMLADASVALAADCQQLTLIAHTEESLSQLTARIASSGINVHQLAYDWARREEFIASIRAHLTRVGFPSLVLAWLHDDSLGLEVVAAATTPGIACDFYHVRGSRTKSAMRDAGSLLEAQSLPDGVSYNQIILGYKISSGRSRWLTNTEISAGVLAALGKRRPVSVVGFASPW